ncbi:helix-turn-helix transcriptional regulator [Paenibacillus taichungensis]|uniref:Helix-turn-helix transcriptional regulator n=1 Tax=Paenibacillus taichungensis TaxID=484184 RepID=A0ABX2MVT0_9BACL|nr:helix-turn-helix transcriptional regulator [Paenibacillus taichungensis]
MSYECGFNDSDYFTRQFTKVYGVSPKTYRQSL